MFKKTLAMLLALIMVLGLVACGGDKPVETNAPEQGGEVQNPEVETPAEPVKITINYPDSSTAPLQGRLAGSDRDRQAGKC